uniref:dickkopf-related protein 4 isoform X2 n=1 Tax=Monopterus albus TaxID=43700 RepID=UPI0009B3A291|nr:dickkopf-related protein 4-like isoform X2 [Monopterus albus]
MMWMWRSVLCVSLVCGLALDSNTIRSSSSEQLRAGCSNRAQRRTVPQDRQADRRRHKDTDTQQDTDSFNRTKAPEMSSCVRSGDCAAGLCCVRYLTGRRCQRIPGEGEACLLRGSSKQKRNLERCDCDKGLTCTPVSWAESAKNKGQGVCLPRPRQGQRKTRHSGKKRRTAERSC